jgi:hypothetical protein
MLNIKTGWFGEELRNWLSSLSWTASTKVTNSNNSRYGQWQMTVLSHPNDATWFIKLMATTPTTQLPIQAWHSYESLIAKLRLVLLTRAFKWNSDPNATVVYCGNSILLTFAYRANRFWSVHQLSFKTDADFDIKGNHLSALLESSHSVA